jgi:hypothetical protein
MIPIDVGQSGGFPRVTWSQKLARTTQGKNLLGTAIVIGLIAGALLGWKIASDQRSNILEMVIFCGLFGAGLAVMAFGKSMQNQSQREWAEKPVLVDCPAFAEIEPADGTLMFTWGFTTGGGTNVSDTVPLDSFDTFEFGTANEWFAEPENRQAFGDCFVIVLHSGSEGTKCVAAHSGSKADIDRLHATLTTCFVNNRRALIARYKQDLARGPWTGGSQGQPATSNEDIPKKL